MVRRKAAAHGAVGEAWLAQLDGVVSDLAQRWHLRIGRTLGGGTESFVAEVLVDDGSAAVLKLAFPWSDPARREMRVLLAAEGRGYVALLRHDPELNAMMLERLGPQLHALGLSTDAQIEIICAALKRAWRPPPDGMHLMNGAAKANELARRHRDLVAGARRRLRGADGRDGALVRRASSRGVRPDPRGARAR